MGSLIKLTLLMTTFVPTAFGAQGAEEALAQAKAIATQLSQENENPSGLDPEVTTLLQEASSLMGPPKTADFDCECLPLTSLEISQTLDAEFWARLSKESELTPKDIMEFSEKNPELEENYNLYKEKYDSLIQSWEVLNAEYENLCPQDRIKISMGKIPGSDKLFQKCLTGLSKISGMRMDIDKLNAPIDRMLQIRIDRLLNR